MNTDTKSTSMHEMPIRMLYINAIADAIKELGTVPSGDVLAVDAARDFAGGLRQDSGPAEGRRPDLRFVRAFDYVEGRPVNQDDNQRVSK